MSQRNPMNDRYQSDERRGTTRKSAASMKPKTKAAASVRVQPKEKTKEQKKAEKKAAREKQARLDRQYYDPPTPEYRKLRKLWWILLIAAIIATMLSWVCRSALPEVGSFIILALAYACIIGALYVDFYKIRKVRRAYQAEMSKKSKAVRAAEKQQKEQERSLEAKEEKNPSSTEEKPQRRNFFKEKFGKKNKVSEQASAPTEEEK